MHYITETLLVGNINDAIEPPPEISAVLLVAAEFAIQPPRGMLFDRIPFSEYAEAEPLLLDQAVNWVEARLSSNRVMVCCRAGMGRSVSVVMAYLCCVEGMAYDEVLKLVMERRPGAMPLPDIEKAIAKVGVLRAARAKGKKNPASGPASRA